MTRIPLVMMVDSAAHNFQIFHVKPQLYALFVEEWRRMCVHTVNFTDTDPGLPYIITTTKQWMFFFFFCHTKMPLVVQRTPSKWSPPCTPPRLHLVLYTASLSLHPYTKEDAWYSGAMQCRPTRDASARVDDIIRGLSAEGSEALMPNPRKKSG